MDGGGWSVCVCVGGVVLSVYPRYPRYGVADVVARVPHSPSMRCEGIAVCEHREHWADTINEYYSELLSIGRHSKFSPFRMPKNVAVHCIRTPSPGHTHTHTHPLNDLELTRWSHLLMNTGIYWNFRWTQLLLFWSSFLSALALANTPAFIRFLLYLLRRSFCSLCSI